MAVVQEVLLVILGDDYGNPAAGPSFEVETFVPAFQNLFGRVTVFPFDRWVADVGYYATAAALLAQVLESHPAAVFCVPFEQQLDWNVFATIRACGVPTIAWMCDDHWRYDTFSKYIAGNFSAVATTDIHAYLRYHDLGGFKPLLTQWGAGRERLRDPNAYRSIPVSFIGAKRPNRERLIRALRSAGVSVTVRGSGWPEGRASTSDLIDIPAASLVALNFADSSLRHRHGRTQLKARPFELAASGACVVTEADPQLRPYFVEGAEVLTFRKERELIRLVKELLADEPQRLLFAQRAHDRVVRDHLYDSRLSRLLGHVGVVVRFSDTPGELCFTK